MPVVPHGNPCNTFDAFTIGRLGFSLVSRAHLLLDLAVQSRHSKFLQLSRHFKASECPHFWECHTLDHRLVLVDLPYRRWFRLGTVSGALFSLRLNLLASVTHSGQRDATPPDWDVQYPIPDLSDHSGNCVTTHIRTLILLE